MKRAVLTMPTYRRFTEKNDWEDETWHFYIAILGNEETITTLERQIKLCKAYCKKAEQGLANC